MGIHRFTEPELNKVYPLLQDVNLPELASISATDLDQSDLFLVHNLLVESKVYPLPQLANCNYSATAVGVTTAGTYVAVRPTKHALPLQPKSVTSSTDLHTLAAVFVFTVKILDGMQDIHLFVVKS